MPDTQPRLSLLDGHSIPQFGFGLWEVPEDKAAEMVRVAADAGYRLFDGAAFYHNETGLGRGLHDSGLKRDEYFVTTKIWNDCHGYDRALKSVDQSLERLGLDRVDLVLIHWPCPQADQYVETWRALIHLRDEGRVTSIGVSNFNAQQIDRLTSETGVTPVLNQVEINPRMQQSDLQDAMTARKIVTQSWSPLGGGYSLEAEPVRAAAERLGLQPAQVILRWHLQRGLSVLSRSVNPERIRQNLRAVSTSHLTDTEMADIAALEEGIRSGSDPAKVEPQ